MGDRLGTGLFADEDLTGGFFQQLARTGTEDASDYTLTALSAPGCDGNAGMHVDVRVDVHVDVDIPVIEPPDFFQAQQALATSVPVHEWLGGPMQQEHHYMGPVECGVSTKNETTCTAPGVGMYGLCPLHFPEDDVLGEYRRTAVALCSGVCNGVPCTKRSPLAPFCAACSPREQKLEVRRSGHRGSRRLGLFAAVPANDRLSGKCLFRKGSVICVYTGFLMRERDIDDRYGRDTTAPYAYTTHKRSVLEKLRRRKPADAEGAANARATDGQRHPRTHARDEFHAYVTQPRNIIDAQYARGFAKFANEPENGEVQNAQIGERYHRDEREEIKDANPDESKLKPVAYIDAFVDIYDGDEILVTYGTEYKHVAADARRDVDESDDEA